MNNNHHFKSNTLAVIQMTGFSLLGIALFFVPITLGSKRTIAFDHMAGYLVNEQRTLAVILLFLLMIYGVAKPFVSGTWRSNATNVVLSAFKVLGLVLAVMYVTGTAPDMLMTKDMLPFLFEKLALPVGMIIPIGALMLSFLIAFGLLEMMGVIMQPVMRPIWRTPGSSAIDAVASFVGSYSVGLLITDRVYLKGMYSAKEAAIIATGFSTVSTAFMVIVAKTLELMPFWNVYFWSCLIITFLVTAITARLPPIRNMDDQKTIADEIDFNQSRLSQAWQTGVQTAKSAPPPIRATTRNTTRPPMPLPFASSSCGCSVSSGSCGSGSGPVHSVILVLHTGQFVLTAPAAHLVVQVQVSGAALPSSNSACRSASSTWLRK